MPEIRITFSFEQGSLTGKHILWLLDNATPFAPTDVRSDMPGKLDARVSLDTFRQSQESTSALVEFSLRKRNDMAVPEFSSACVGGQGLEALYWNLSIGEMPGLDVLEHMTTWPGFNTGLIRDRRDDHTEELTIGMWLQSCWRMWFGGYPISLTGRERLLAFPGASQIRELESGAVFVELYEAPEEFELPERREVQDAFHEWVDMKGVIEKADLRVAELDPWAEYEERPSSGGGTLLIRRWRDKSGKETTRSKAYTEFEVEVDRAGNVLRRTKRRIRPAGPGADNTKE